MFVLAGGCFRVAGVYDLSAGCVGVQAEQAGQALLGGPCPVWVGSHPEDAYPPGRYLHDEQHIQAPQEDLYRSRTRRVLSDVRVRGAAYAAL